MTAITGGVVLLATAGPATNIVYHALSRAFPDVTLVVEQPVPRLQMAGRRVKRLGLTTVVGQLLFIGLVVPLLRRRGQRRVGAIVAAHGLADAPVEADAQIGSVNSDEARELLSRLQPAAVVVNGTRIIADETLKCTDAPFVNMHAGITPQYRGVHGGYWALVERRRDLVGTTVHFVDTGIDTGPIIGQARFEVSNDDSFTTYPYLHVAAGLPLLLRAVEEILTGAPPVPVPPLSGDAPSKLRSHPTLWGYIFHRLTAGVA